MDPRHFQAKLGSKHGGKHPQRRPRGRGLSLADCYEKLGERRGRRRTGTHNTGVELPRLRTLLSIQVTIWETSETEFPFIQSKLNKTRLLVSAESYGLTLIFFCYNFWKLSGLEAIYRFLTALMTSGVALLIPTL